MMTANIRTIQSQDYDAVFKLHRDHYWRTHCLILNPVFYQWQFLGPPESVEAGGDQSLVSFDDDGNLLSYLGVFPMTVTHDGSQLTGAHLITWLTSPAARGRGVGKEIMRYVTDSYDFCFGRSVTPAALAIYQQLGFRYFQHCARWLMILNAEATISLAVQPTEQSIRRIRFRTIMEETPVPYSVSPLVPSGAETLIATIFKKGVAFRRTAAYLTWRYSKHPFLKYVFLTIGDCSAPRAIAALRIEVVRGRAGTVLRVLEFLAPPHHGKDLASAIAAYGVNAGCAFVDLFGISERFVSGFLTAGGFNAVEEAEIRLPHLLQPWEPCTEPPGILFFGKRHPTVRYGIGPADDLSNIYISKGDGNMDWPSWVPSDDDSIIAPSTCMASDS